MAAVERALAEKPGDLAGWLTGLDEHAARLPGQAEKLGEAIREVPRDLQRWAGPKATTRRTNIARWREILYMLVLRDLKARTKQAYLGYLWILIQPLLLTGVFSFLIQQVLGRTDLSDIPYPVFLMAGVIPWQFFANSLNESAESLVKNVDLVRQVYFPREILAIYPVFARLIDVLVGCVALGAFGTALGSAGFRGPLLGSGVAFCCVVPTF